MTHHDYFGLLVERARTGLGACGRLVDRRLRGSHGGIGAGRLSADGDFEQRRFAIQSLIVLFLVSGLAAAVTAASANVDESSRFGLSVVAGLDIAIAGLVFVLRRRWGRRGLLVMILPALAIFAYGNYVDVDPVPGRQLHVRHRRLARYLPARFVNVALAPLYGLAYWLPFWLHPHGPTFDQSVLSVVVVAVASGETVAWFTGRLAALSARLSVEAGKQLAASEESFRLLFQLSPLPTMVFDPVGLRCLRANDAACTHYGYSLDELLETDRP